MSNPIKNELKKRILLLDGAMGTALQGKNLSARDFGGESLYGCNENLVLSCPSIIGEVHAEYLEAGADIIETNTFGGTRLVLDEYDLGSKTMEINRRAAELARESISSLSNNDLPRFVAGSMGPTTKAISVTGGVSFQRLREDYAEQVLGLMSGGVDYLLIETAQDTRNVKAAVLGAMDSFAKQGKSLPLAVSGTIEPMGTMLAGQNIEAFWTSISHLDLLYVGLNCATGPEFMTDHLRTLSKMASTNTACVPNAGLPDEDGNYLETPQLLASKLEYFLKEAWLNLLGGCCGTTAPHIKALSEIRARFDPRPIPSDRRSAVSGIDYLEVNEDIRPVIIGERTNVIGSRKFKTLICDEKFEEAAEIARKQIKSGAQIVDVCLANPDREEFQDMENFLKAAIKIVKAPLMIDSTDSKIIEMALTYSQGKSIINSINLEDGEERFEEVVPLAKAFGAALVVGTIDDDPDQGMGVTCARKLEIAEREYELLTKKYGFPEEDIYWDVLVFPCATGDEQYIGSAKETVEGIRQLKKKYPLTKSTLGISNVSFGLPTAGREVLNSVFLYHCTQAGLDTAIVNSQLLVRYASISDEEKRLCEGVLFDGSSDTITQFTEFYRSRKKKKAQPKKSTLSLNERLASYLVEGTKEGLIEDLELARKNLAPLDIINGPLMKGMDEVGRLFNNNELIVAEVLQSAEVMKAAVAHLEPYMEKKDVGSRGKVLLATVKGDVHDIGKNLVDIILSNNGFKVHNIGIKITPERLIEECKKFDPDIIGLSGLLVKSAHQMVTTAKDLAHQNISIPLLVGGAALSKNFTHNKIAPEYKASVFYAADAMQGLQLVKGIVDGKITKQEHTVLKVASKQSSEAIDPSAVSDILPLDDVPAPPDLKRHVLKNTPIEHIWDYINPRMLYGRHLGLGNSEVDPLFSKDPKVQASDKALKLHEQVMQVKQLCKDQKLLNPQAVFQFFPVLRQGRNQVQVLSSDLNETLESFEFPRQKKSPHLCLADYVRAQTPSDYICFFVTTAGHGVREYAEKLKAEGQFLFSHTLSALALETAEAFAEYLHKKVREIWNLESIEDQAMSELFKAKYVGKRYSFGYPACPDLEEQEKLFKLLKPSDLGVDLTEGCMMEPEASVSGLIFHHPKAQYFSV